MACWVLPRAWAVALRCRRGSGASVWQRQQSPERKFGPALCCADMPGPRHCRHQPKRLLATKQGGKTAKRRMRASARCLFWGSEGLSQRRHKPSERAIRQADARALTQGQRCSEPRRVAEPLAHLMCGPGPTGAGNLLVVVVQLAQRCDKRQERVALAAAAAASKSNSRKGMQPCQQQRVPRGPARRLGAAECAGLCQPCAGSCWGGATFGC
jgi:hypothetical protein